MISLNIVYVVAWLTHAIWLVIIGDCQFTGVSDLRGLEEGLDFGKFFLVFVTADTFWRICILGMHDVFLELLSSTEVLTQVT